MEVQELYENLTFWEHDLGFPEGTWTEGLLDGSHNDVGRNELGEGDSFWEDADFPLKEASKDKVIKDRLDDQNFDFNVDLDQDAWLDERIDLGAALDDFIRSPEFEAVFNEINDSPESLHDIVDLPDQHQIIDDNINPEIEILSTSEPAVEEIETDEVTFDETAVIYLNPCEMSSPSVEHYTTLDSNDVQYIVSPSISKTSSDEAVSIEVVEDVVLKEESVSNPDSDEVAEIKGEDSPVVLLHASSLKSKRNRRVIRAEPYRNVMEESNSSFSNSSSEPGSPSSSCLSDNQDTQPKYKRKERKKCQNRNAATKYRQKKRAECEAISLEEQELESKNKDLKEKVNQLSNEIGYLKGLMREILIAKGLINK